MIDIADEQQRGPVRQRTQQSPHQRHVDHRGLVNDEQVTLQRVVLIAPEHAGPWVSLNEAVDGLRFEPSALGQAFGGATGWRTERDCDGFRKQDLED